MSSDDQVALRAARAGDERAFALVTEPYRRELLVHCYRMLGSYDDAEDLVQESLLRAWQNIGGFAGRSSLRTWLYRIATNACLDALKWRRRRVLPDDAHLDETEWLQPFPGPFPDPDAAAEDRETLELVFLVAVQHLPPLQRAVLILRDLLSWPAVDTAEALDTSVASANSALQRARDTLRRRLPDRRLDRAPVDEPTDEHLAVVRRYIDAVQRADLGAVAALLAEDVRATMPPSPVWFDNRAAAMAAMAASWDPGSPAWVGRLRAVPTRANGRPAAAFYASRDDVTFSPFAISVFEVEQGRIVAMTAFHEPTLFPAFGLPMTFPADCRLPG